MSSGQGCVLACTLPGEIFQVRAAALLTQVLEVVISLILSEQEEMESI